MAPTTQPTRSSSRIRERKDAAGKAAAAAIVKTNDPTKNARKGKGKGKGKGKATRKTTPSKIAKRATVKKTSRTPTKKAYHAHHRFFLEPEQLSSAIEQHQTDGNQQMWVGGKFYAADPDEEVPIGSIEIDIKVPSGFKFLQFPGVLRLVEGEEMEEEREEEREQEE
jgi:hypothetical protein